jgi:hypothetical protein
MNARPRRRTAGFALAFAACLAASQLQSQDTRPDAGARDRYNRPVFNAQGEPLVYGRPDGVRSLQADEGWPLSSPALAPASALPLSPVASPLTPEWMMRVPGTAIGQAFLEVIDLDADGDREIVASASGWGFGANRYWYILESTGSGYRPVWYSRSYAPEFYAGLIAQVDADPQFEVLIGSGTNLHIVDGKTRETEGVIAVNTGEIRDVDAADLDGDGTIEIVVSGWYALSIYDVATQALEQTFSNYRESSIAVGNVDAEPGLEIVVSMSYASVVLNAATRAIEWDAWFSFGGVQIGDVDQDSRNEIVGRFAWDGIAIFDADLRLQKTTIPIFNTDAIKLADVDGDGYPEILYGDAQHGSLHVLDGRNYGERFPIPNPGGGATRIAVGDADHNGTREILWGSGRNTTAADYLNVFGVNSQALEWRSEPVGGPFYALAHGDVDADGNAELLDVVYSYSAMLTIRDGATKNIEYRGPSATSNWLDVLGLAHGNLDDDPQSEILVGTGQTYSGELACFDGVTHLEQWRTRFPSGLLIASTTVADVDLDGDLEVIVGSYGEHTGAPNGYVYVLNGRTGAIEWRSPSVGGTFTRVELLRVGNIDSDPQPEILAGTGSRTWILDAVNGSASVFNTPLTALELSDIDRNGQLDIVGGTVSGDVVILSPTTLQTQQTIGRFGSRIEALRVMDFNGGHREVVIARDEEVLIADTTGCVRWQTGKIGTAYGYGSTHYTVGYSDSLIVGELDGDDAMEIVVNVGPSGMDQYEVGPYSLASACGAATAPSFSVQDASLAEGQPGEERFAAFPVRLSQPIDLVTRVKFHTVSETAVAGEDYFSTPGSLTFAPGETVRTVYVRLKPDATPEATETFRLELHEPSNAGLGDAVAEGRIVNDDELGLSVSGFDVAEGDAGTSNAVFTVRLAGQSPNPVSVLATITSGTAERDVDYAVTSPALVTLAPSVVEQQLPVSVFGDIDVENSESIFILLSSPTNATLTQATATGWIRTDDGPVVSVSPTSVAEGYTGTTPARFRVRLSNPLPDPVSVSYETEGGSAISDQDFQPVQGSVVFAPGETDSVVAVPVKGDTTVEPNEAFTLRLTSATGASLLHLEGAGRILNDDGPTLSVTNAEVTEGTGASSSLRFTVVTSAVTAQPISASIRTSDGTARAGEDYSEFAQTITLPPGVASLSVLVPVAADSNVEPDETMKLTLLSATGATIFDEEAIGTILADDGLLVRIKDKSGAEGNTGTSPLTFTLSLNKPSLSTVTVDFETEDGTATAPLDYVTAMGTVTFNPGETAKTLTVQIVGETAEETYETLLVNLSNPTGGVSLADAQGQGTITNTDGSTDRSRLMFHNFVTNRLYRWHMKDGNTLDTFNWVTPWATDPGWTVGAIADFDQDGQLDYLWHNVDDGRLLFWYIDGDNLKGFQFLPYKLDPGWRVAATFDANNDGAPDLAYYDARASTASGTSGRVAIFLHDNASQIGSYLLNPSLPVAGAVRIVNAVDADNDGDDELVLFNSATGRVQAWNVAGANVSGTIDYATPQVTSPSFKLVSTKTDFNDDGLADFLWHNPTPTGVFSVWFMNGTTRLGVGQFLPFTATDPVWTVVGSANVW